MKNRVGETYPVTATITRQAKDGEIYLGKPITHSNRFGNLWWATIGGGLPEFLICLDDEATPTQKEGK